MHQLKFISSKMAEQEIYSLPQPRQELSEHK